MRHLNSAFYRNESLLTLLEKYDSLLFGNKWAPSGCPLFVCGLARSGTTIVTHIINQHQDTGSLTYHDLPFIEAAYSWNKLSRLFYGKANGSEERIHGDGLYVGGQSPDAFEELLWQGSDLRHTKKDFPKVPLQGEEASFEARFRTLMNKVTFIRGKKKHYLSKGNYNLFRIPFILGGFPNAKVVICLRNPIDHISSLTRVHEKFMSLSQEHPNIGKELENLGHYEFGPQRRALNIFEEDYNKTLAAWEEGDEEHGYLHQWIAAGKHILKLLESEHRDSILLIDNHELCTNPQETTKRILTFCELNTSKSVSEEFSKIIHTTPSTYKKDKVMGEDMSAALQLYKKLISYTY